MNQPPDASDIAHYYAAALLGLRYLEAKKPTGRRFGADADARWSSFNGDLTTRDRIDLLIRDADAQWPEAFGARTTFNDRAVAEDAAFGPDFPGLDPIDAEALWTATVTKPATTTLDALLAAVARAWKLKVTAIDVPAVAPADRLVVAGPGAIIATALAFEQGGRALDWRDQVVVVATPPAHRQLAALVGAMLGITQPANVLAATDTVRPGRRITSSDADAADLGAVGAAA